MDTTNSSMGGKRSSDESIPDSVSQNSYLSQTATVVSRNESRNSTFSYTSSHGGGQSGSHATDFLTQLSEVAAKRLDEDLKHSANKLEEQNRVQSAVTHDQPSTFKGDANGSCLNVQQKNSPIDSLLLKQSQKIKAKMDKGYLRKGKWTPEEEEFTSKIIQHFRSGLLTLPEGTTLRLFIAQKLSCDPMRITKKFAGSSCLGKRVYHLHERSQFTVHDIEMAKVELNALERRFKIRIEEGHCAQTFPVSSSLMMYDTRQPNYAVPTNTFGHPLMNPINPFDPSWLAKYSSTLGASAISAPGLSTFVLQLLASQRMQQAQTLVQQPQNGNQPPPQIQIQQPVKQQQVFASGMSQNMKSQQSSQITTHPVQTTNPMQTTQQILNGYQILHKQNHSTNNTNINQSKFVPSIHQLSNQNSPLSVSATSVHTSTYSPTLPSVSLITKSDLNEQKIPPKIQMPQISDNVKSKNSSEQVKESKKRSKKDVDAGNNLLIFLQELRRNHAEAMSMSESEAKEEDQCKSRLKRKVNSIGNSNSAALTFNSKPRAGTSIGSTVGLISEISHSEQARHDYHDGVSASSISDDTRSTYAHSNEGGYNDTSSSEEEQKHHSKSLVTGQIRKKYRRNECSYDMGQNNLKSAGYQ